MATEEELNELEASGAEAEAREMGWVPKDEFRGDPEKWVTAAAFVEHGRHVMPIMRKNNERLLAEQSRMRTQLAEVSRQLEAAREDFTTLEEFHNEEVTRRTEELRKQLKANMKTARESGDVDAEIEATDQLTRLNTQVAEVEDEEERPARKNGAEAPQFTPEYLAWKEHNDWFDVDPERTYEAMAVAARLNRENPQLKGAAFYAAVDKALATATPRRQTKVGASAGGASQGGVGGRTYADLPAEAKAACDKYAKKFVNPNGRFKTAQDYQKHYIAQLEETGYFS